MTKISEIKVALHHVGKCLQGLSFYVAHQEIDAVEFLRSVEALAGSLEKLGVGLDKELPIEWLESGDKS